MNKQKLIILSAEPKNFVPENLKKEADALGFEAQIVDIRHTFLSESIKNPKVMYVENDQIFELAPPFSCIPRLNEHNLLYKINVLKQLELSGAFMLNSAKSMELCNDKLESQIRLTAENIITPFSVVLGSIDMIEPSLKFLETEGKLKFPMIVKTLRGTHGIGVMKVDSRSSLVSVVQTLITQNMEVMLQEFIEHDSSLRIIMIGDQVLASNRRGQPKSKDEFRTNAHLGSETEKYLPGSEEIAIAQKIVELFGCNFCAIDYIMKDQSIIILEVNGSPGLENIQENWKDEKNLASDVIKGLQRIMNPYKEHEVSQEIPQENVVKDDFNDSQEITNKISQDPSIPYEAPLNDVEELKIVRLADEGLSARVDTGAAYSCIHVEEFSEDNNWIKFKRNDITYKVPIDRMIKIRNSHGLTRRPVIKLDIIFRNIRHNQIEFTISNRNEMKYDALIGRNLLQVLGIPVLVPGDNKDRKDLGPANLEVEEE